MRILILSLTFVLVASLTTLAQNTDSATRAQEILKQARTAIGDKSKLTSLSASGSSRRTFGEREMSSEIELEIIMPDKIRRTTTSSPFPGADFQSTEVMNGNQIWTDFTSSQPQMGGPGGRRGPRMIMSGSGNGNESQRQQSVRTEFLRLLLGMLAMPPAGIQVEYSYAGEAKAPDGIADIIEVKGPGEATSRLFVDRNSHRVVMLSYRGKDFRQAMQIGQRDRQNMTSEEREQHRKELEEMIAKLPEVDYFWRFGEFKSVGGLTLPHLITKAIGDQVNEEWTINKIKPNPNIKTEKFDKKEKK